MLILSQPGRQFNARVWGCANAQAQWWHKFQGHPSSVVASRAAPGNAQGNMLCQGSNPGQVLAKHVP